MLGVPNATITIQRGQGTGQTASETTDASGLAPPFTRLDNSLLTPGEYTFTVSADGYQTVSQTIQVTPAISAPPTVVIQLPRSEAALVFRTFSGSPPSPQPATVTIVSQDGGQSWTGATILTPDAKYAAVTFPNLPPSTTYDYVVGAPGFQTVKGSTTTPSATASSLYTGVDVLLPPPPMPVEFRTSVLSPAVAGELVGTQAIVTVGNSSVTTNRATGTYYSGTQTLQANTTYEYAAVFTQFAVTLKGSFTTPSSTPVTGSYPVPIILDFGHQGGIGTKSLP
jgi:hypothetical protein